MEDAEHDQDPVTLPRWVVFELMTGSAGAYKMLGAMRDAGFKGSGALAEIDMDRFERAIHAAETVLGYETAI